MFRKDSCCCRNTDLHREEMIAVDRESVGRHPFSRNAVQSAAQ